MSLKAIHIVFILASMGMTLFFGFWSWQQYRGPEGSQIDLAYLGASIAALAGLIIYGRYFLRKLKHISYL